MALPNSNLKLSQALSEFNKNTPGSMSDLAGEQATPNAVPNTPYKMSDLFGLENKVSQTIYISSNTQNVSLTDYSLNSDYIDVTFVIQSGVVVGSSSTGSTAFIMNNLGLRSGSTVTIINHGYIVGRGGNGGNANDANNPGGSNGGSGGRAIWAGSYSYPVYFQNNGIIGGGGGGGGGVADFGLALGGGGGAGNTAGSGGNASSATTTRNGYSGSLTSGGSGRTGSIHVDKDTTRSSESGDGGNLGQNGQSATGGVDRGSGGSGGQAISGYNNISWQTTGDIRGSTS